MIIYKQEIRNNDIANVLNLIHDSIRAIGRLNIERDYIYISLSDLFWKMLERYNAEKFLFQKPPQFAQGDERKLFGVNVVPNYENSVVIFCKDWSFYTSLSNLVIKIEYTIYSGLTNTEQERRHNG